MVSPLARPGAATVEGGTPCSRCGLRPHRYGSSLCELCENELRPLDPFAPAVIAADYIVAALGEENARLAVAALCAGWMTDDEAARLEPLAAAVARMIGMPALPQPTSRRPS